MRPLTDQRPTSNQDRVWFYLVPFVPYGWQEFDRPERVPAHVNSGSWQFSPGHDISKALAAEIDARHMFRSVSYEDNGTEPTYVLTGGLTSAQYAGKLWSYGLSIAGPPLWLIGLPAGSVRNSLAFTLTLEQTRSRQIVWERRYAVQHDEGLFGLYNLGEDFHYAELLKKLMPAILEDLEHELRRGD